MQEQSFCVRKSQKYNDILVNQIVSVEEAKDARRRTLQEQIDYSRELYLNKKHHERKDSQEKSSKKQDKSSSNKSSLKKRIKNDIEFDSSSSQSSLQGSINDRKSQENLKNFSRHTISEANESNLTSFKTDSDVEMQTPIEPNADQPQLIFQQSSQPKEGTPMHDRKGTSYFPEERDVYEFKRIETLKNQSPEPLTQTEEKQKQSEAKTISKLMIKAGTYYGFGQAKDSIELPDIPEPKITQTNKFQNKLEVILSQGTSLGPNELTSTPLILGPGFNPGRCP